MIYQSLKSVKVNHDDAIYSMESLLTSVKTTPYPIYLLIDEYDNFANTIMMGVHRDKTRYDALVHDEGILRTLFKAVKSSTSDGKFEKVFITGVSPVVLSDITSGYNIAKDIYFHPRLNDLCGFSLKEVSDLIEKIVDECDLGDPDGKKTKEALELIKTYYNDYRFAFSLDDYIYNPTLCLYFFEQFQEMCTYPREMLDDNLAADESKLEYIAQIPMGRELIVELIQKANVIAISKVSKRFGIKDMLDKRSKNNTFLVSFLYFFGVLTLAGETDDLKIRLKVPNMVIQSLYVERVQKMLLPEPATRDDGILAAEKVYQKGDIRPLCDFVEQNYFKVFKNRDYRWANELTLKTAFLTLLYNDIIFIMDSETKLSRRYADLTMIIRPDKRYGKVFDVLIEFKFLSLKSLNLTGNGARQLSKKEIYDISQVKDALNEGEDQVTSYGKSLEEKYGNLRLQKFVVASLGFERLSFKKIS